MDHIKTIVAAVRAGKRLKDVPLWQSLSGDERKVILKKMNTCITKVREKQIAGKEASPCQQKSSPRQQKPSADIAAQLAAVKAGPSYLSATKMMMTAYGDCCEPCPDSALVILKATHTYMRGVLLAITSLSAQKHMKKRASQETRDKRRFKITPIMVGHLLPEHIKVINQFMC